MLYPKSVHHFRSKIPFLHSTKILHSTYPILMSVEKWSPPHTPPSHAATSKSSTSWICYCTLKNNPSKAAWFLCHVMRSFDLENLVVSGEIGQTIIWKDNERTTVNGISGQLIVSMLERWSEPDTAHHGHRWLWHHMSPTLSTTTWHIKMKKSEFNVSLNALCFPTFPRPLRTPNSQLRESRDETTTTT